MPDLLGLLGFRSLFQTSAIQTCTAMRRLDALTLEDLWVLRRQGLLSVLLGGLPLVDDLP